MTNSRLTPALLCGAFFLLLFTHQTTRAEELVVKLPPASLAQWYKPQNKRQVWLHTMFSLRRSMQALEEYVERGEPQRLAKWADDFATAYERLGEMVPEWRDELELEWSGRMRQAAVQGDMEGVRHALGKVRTSCRSCHNEYRTVTSILYRGPDFGAITIANGANEGLSHKELMAAMSRAVNQVKIFHEDQQPQRASEAGKELQRLLTLAADSCAQCHQESESRARIFSAASDRYQSDLLDGIAAQDGKQVDGNLGKIGAFICARCHTIHRPLAEFRAMLTKRAQR
ncbi:MAG: cytochrome c [Gammaproteobacteria bacterium]|nr:cytochrome c [Gammaproteobacteria bacterium]